MTKRNLAIVATAWAAVVVGGTLPAGSTPSPVATFLLRDSVGEDGALLGFRVAPNEHDIVLGSSMAWSNQGRLPHELEDRSGLFRWGPIPPGETETFRPWAAGRYEFHDGLEDALGSLGDWEAGTLNVAPLIDGERWWYGSRRPRIRWATRPADDGLVYDVQVSRGRGWTWWRRGTTLDASRYWIPHYRVRGDCFGVRARLRSRGGGRLGWGQTYISCFHVDFF